MVTPARPGQPSQPGLAPSAGNGSVNGKDPEHVQNGYVTPNAGGGEPAVYGRPGSVPDSYGPVYQDGPPTDQYPQQHEPSVYEQAQYGQAQYEQGQYEQGQYEQGQYEQGQYEQAGYDRAGNYRAGYDQQTVQPPQAYDRAGYDQQTVQPPQAYDRAGYDQQTVQPPQAYDRAGYDQQTVQPPQAYDRAGYDQQTAYPPRPEGYPPSWPEQTRGQLVVDRDTAPPAPESSRKARKAEKAARKAASRVDRDPRRTEQDKPTSVEWAPAGALAGEDAPVPRKAKIRLPKKANDRVPEIELAIREIAGHLTFTNQSVTAWYLLPEIQWSFRSDAEREAVLRGIAAQFAGLGGYRIHLRRTTRPYPAAQWAQRLHALTPHPLPDIPGAPSWADHLEAGQLKLRQTNVSEGETYLGVVFQRRTMREQFAEAVNQARKRGVGQAERARLAVLVARFSEVLGAFGMRARPATSAQVEWLLHRSVALGLPSPSRLSTTSSDQWESADLLSFTENILRYRSPYGDTVRLVARYDDRHIERHVAVLTFGRMEELQIPEMHEPWLHFAERLPWPMELSSRFDVLGPGDALKALQYKLRVIRSQQRDYAEHEMDAPVELERLAQRAIAIEDEMATGLELESTRVHGWHRIAVAGTTREECLRRARAVTDHYQSIRISIQHPRDQFRLLSEFIPGQPIANTGYLRRMPAKYFAAAVPQAASTVGDRRGPVIGETCGTSRRPVMWDPHYATEVRERSGLAVFIAEPGGGKSTLMGGVTYLAARRGIQCTLLDPSGPLARLAEVPELAPYSKVYNLTGADSGTLAPYALIPTPHRRNYRPGPLGDKEWELDVADARAERSALAVDICTMLLPAQVARERATPLLLGKAARRVNPTEDAALDDLVAELRVLNDDGVELADALDGMRDYPLSRLFFGRPEHDPTADEAVLTVVTMAGLPLPDLRIEREHWSLKERMALPMLHLATAFASRRAYGLGMSERKLIGLDETHFLANWGSGRALFNRLARDSRKWNIAALAASQNPVDVLGLDVNNLVSTVFVGRVADDPDVAAQALQLLRIPRGAGYEETLAKLSETDPLSDDRLGYREFVMRDVDGRVQKFRVDLSYIEGLLGSLDTTAAPEGSLQQVSGRPRLTAAQQLAVEAPHRDGERR